jgi:hypothetical protein
MGFCAVPAFAQGPGGPGRGPQLSQEDREAAWALQVKGVAKSLGLSEEVEKKVLEAYAASRKSQQAAMQAVIDSGQGPGRFQELQKVNEAERAKLKEALAGVLSAEQAEKAAETLGSFHRQWDRLAKAVADLKLDDEKQLKALSAVEKYVVDSNAAMAKAMESQDFQSMRTVGQELRSKLDTAMGEVLDADQLAKWKESTAMGGGGLGGPGGRRGPRGEGDAPGGEGGAGGGTTGGGIGGGGAKKAEE